jgi:hypothetical protein
MGYNKIYSLTFPCGKPKSKANYNGEIFEEIVEASVFHVVRLCEPTSTRWGKDPLPLYLPIFN